MTRDGTITDVIGCLEGHHVEVTLADGSQIADCELVSAGHRGVESLWVCIDGTDMFVPLVEVTEVREVLSSAARCTHPAGSAGMGIPGAEGLTGC